MTEALLFVLCGILSGLLGGYLGIGGGVITVPFLTIILGIDIAYAVPASVISIIITSFASSNEYLKKGMVDLELVVLLSAFMVLGNIVGSGMSPFIPKLWIQLLLGLLLIYTAFSLLRTRKEKSQLSFQDNRVKYIVICTLLAFLTGSLSGLLGIGGGAILVPLLHLVIGVPLTAARGTSALMIGSSSAAAAAVYFFGGMVNVAIAAPVAFGAVLGGKLGGLAGTVAKPLIVKIIFFVVMLYLAWKLGMPAVQEAFQ